MRLAMDVVSLLGGGDGKCALCVAVSISRSLRSSSTRLACSCSPAVTACARRAESRGASLLVDRLLDLRRFSSALVRRLDSGEERLLRGGRNAPVGVVDIARMPTQENDSLLLAPHSNNSNNAALNLIMPAIRSAATGVEGTGDSDRWLDADTLTHSTSGPHRKSVCCVLVGLHVTLLYSFPHSKLS